METPSKRLYLTETVLQIERGQDNKTVAKSLKDSGYSKEFFAEHFIGKKISQIKKRSSCDEKKYIKIRKLNLHKMEPIPFCKIPK
jgi:ribosomal protein L14E/L6E/L27E